jgi:hypothetical protein
MSYKDDYVLFMNLMAQSPEGLGDPMLIGKFSKAKFQLNQMSAMAENMPIASPQPSQGIQSLQMAQGMPNEQLGATGLENNPNPMNSGQGGMNLP